jgi:hypothetical protein
MPGLFGAVGAPPDTLDLLEREFRARWPDARIERARDSLICGHAFANALAVHRIGPSLVLAVDGEWSLYREAADEVTRDADRFLTVRDDAPDLEFASAGNAALLDLRSRSISLAVDPSGAFPLYYVERGGGLLFGSLLRPLALAISASRDDLAVLEFLRQAYTVDGKTVYSGIRRLLPGQALTYRPGSTLRLHERSTAWAGRDDLAPDEAVDRAWDGLAAAVRRGRPADSSALMMSGGWDSRTLLAAMDAAGSGIMCYSHGDTASRELRLVRRLSDTVGVRCRLEPIDDRALDPDHLRRGFERTENVIFPHWHRAGQLLADEGITCIAAGVFGEILGGHYGPAMVAGTVGKARSIAGSLLGRGVRRSASSGPSAREYLRTPRFGRHWYLAEQYETAIEAPHERMDAAVDSALRRLEARGAREPVALVEAFVSEHRGTQYINAQLLSCRAATDVSLPFAGGELFSFSTRVPLDAKIHNTLNRRMLARYAPALLRVPMAATLVPARYPLFAQEASRVVRKVFELSATSLHRATGGVIPSPRLTWANFEFLRDGQSLLGIVEDLHSEIWDRDAMRHQIAALEAQPRAAFRPGPMLDQLSKVYTIDLTMR